MSMKIDRDDVLVEFLSRAFGFLERATKFTQRWCVIAAVVLANMLVAVFAVTWCWAAIQERLPSWLPGVRQDSATPLVLWFLGFLLVINVSQIVLIAVRGRGLAHDSRKGPRSRTYRVAIGKVWPPLSAAAEIAAFRVIWNIYQLSGSAVKFHFLLVVQAYGVAIIIFAGLSWVNRVTVQILSKLLHASLVPVIAVSENRRIVLSDGSSFCPGQIKDWPARRWGVARIVTTTSDCEGKDVYVTVDGDFYYPKKAREQN
jgi:hypothetical protein